MPQDRWKNLFFSKFKLCKRRGVFLDGARPRMSACFVCRVVVLLARFTTALLLSQSFYSGVSGAIRDRDGRAVPSARVTLFELATDVSRINVSTATGHY